MTGPGSSIADMLAHFRVLRNVGVYPRRCASLPPRLQREKIVGCVLRTHRSLSPPCTPADVSPSSPTPKLVVGCVLRTHRSFSPPCTPADDSPAPPTPKPVVRCVLRTHRSFSPPCTPPTFRPPSNAEAGCRVRVPHAPFFFSPVYPTDVSPSAPTSKPAVGCVLRTHRSSPAPAADISPT